MDIAAVILSALALVACAATHLINRRQRWDDLPAEIDSWVEDFARTKDVVERLGFVWEEISRISGRIAGIPDAAKAFEDLVARAQGVLDDADARLARVDDQPKPADGGAVRPAAIPFWQPKATAGTVTQTIQGTPLSGPGAQADA